MDLCLFDSSQWETLLPLTYTRSVADLRLGYYSIREKWEHLSTGKVSIHSVDYLSPKYQGKEPYAGIMINSSVLPSLQLWDAIKVLSVNEGLMKDGTVVAYNSSEPIDPIDIPQQDLKEFDAEIIIIKRYWDVFKSLEKAIALDMEILSSKRSSKTELHATEIIGDNIFLGEGVQINGAIINTKTGPVIIGNHAEVMEGSVIRGPFVLGDHSNLKMGAKIYGASSIGPHCKIGGEVSNSMFQGFSNKGHDGFVGNSVIGEWCNFGADTNVSNLKNNYSNVKVWDYGTQSYIDSEQQFCGLCMGDHSKTGINTMLNTGTVVGVSSNVFGSGFPPKFIPSFSWGGESGFSEYDFDKAVDTAKRVMERRNIDLNAIDSDILSHIRQKEGHFFSKK